MEFSNGEFHGRPALINNEGQAFSLDEQGHISFGDVCWNLIRQQCQYGSRYVNEYYIDTVPFIGTGLRLSGDPRDYHSLGIHPEDVDAFVERYQNARTYERGYVEENGTPRFLTHTEIDELRVKLQELGAFASSKP